MGRHKNKNPYVSYTMKIPEEYLGLADVVANKLAQDPIFRCMFSEINKNVVFRLALRLGLDQLSGQKVAALSDIQVRQHLK